jgi:hypothetical protein
VTKKLPEKQVQHFVEQHGRAVGRVRSAPEGRAQRNGISRERDEGSWFGARNNESGLGAALGGSRTADVRHARAKALNHRSEAIRDKIRGGSVVSPWDGTSRISEERPEQSQGFGIASFEFVGRIFSQ